MGDENKRINIEDLPMAEKELTDEDEKGVTGGGDFHRLFGDPSVTANTGRASEATKGNTIGGSLAGDVSNPTKP